MMDEREIDSHNRGPLPNTLASESVTSAIDEAERQNRQRAIMVAAVAVVGSIIAAFILLQFLSGGDNPVSTASTSEPAVTQPPLVEAEDPVAFDDPEPAAGETTPGEEPATLATASTEAPSAIDVTGYDAPTNPVGTEPMTLRGMGDIALGMTVAEAEAAIGGTVIEPAITDTTCVQTRIGGDPQSPVLMIAGTGEFSSRQIVRIDMVSGNATRSGIGIATPAAEVNDVYGERIVATEDTLTYVPADDVDADYRIVMNIVGDIVLSANNGELPYATWDGCES